jgi:chromate reductase, NAD(P)H dehydrogenase (quinone)
MEKRYAVAVLVGSLRKDSWNLKLAKALTRLAPENLSFDFIETGDLPLYNPDLDNDSPPAAWQRFRASIHAVDALLFVTPEHNRSIPASLKNALDVGSRPMGQSVWNAKPAAVASASPGGMGGFGASHILRQSLVSLNVPALPQPEVYIGGVAQFFDAEGNIAKPDSEAFLKKFMLAFGQWIDRNAVRQD